jgi:SAM-dependent methyltransferase
MEPTDPKAGERSYYARLGPEGRRHAQDKPFSDSECGKYLADIGAMLLMLEPPPRSVIDFGCGAGWTSLFLARAGYDVLGVDISEDAIALARAAGAAAGSSAKFAVADYEGFTAGAQFDYALFYDSLHHAEDEQAAVEAAFRVLKPGGVLFAFEPGAGHSRSPGARHAASNYGVHEKDMSPSYVRRLGRRAGFERALWLPLPRDLARHVFRRDYLRVSGAFRLMAEKLWGCLHAAAKIRGASRSGLILMWKPLGCPSTPQVLGHSRPNF